jgi:hypothetical protein
MALEPVKTPILAWEPPIPPVPWIPPAMVWIWMVALDPPMAPRMDPAPALPRREDPVEMAEMAPDEPRALMPILFEDWMLTEAMPSGMF